MQTSVTRHLLWLLLGILIMGCGGEQSAQSSRPDVLLITIDTLRADQIHAYGFPLESTPNLDALAERGALFETAIAASSRTVPSHASMFSSRFAREHSVGTFNGSSRLEGVETLAERFHSAGYETAAFVSNFVLKRRTGLDRGFDVYDDELPGTEANREDHFEKLAEETTRRALAWLAQRDGRQPVFLWVHYQDPHGPYVPPSGFMNSLDWTPTGPDPELPLLDRDTGRAGIPRYQAIPESRRPSVYRVRYAEEVAYTDYWLGKLVASFEKFRRTDNNVMLVTADHGESLGESGYFFQHGQFSSPEQTRVPFIVVAPGIQAARHKPWVSHVDVAPTLLDLAGLPPLSNASGLSLEPLLKNGTALAPRTLYAETPRELSAYREGGYLRIRPGSLKPSANVRNPLDPQGDLRWEQFQRGTDGRWKVAERPKEIPPAVQEFLRERVPKVNASVFDESDVARLRALGYLPE